ncbi:MAG: hypothetical protein ACLRZ2_01735 [Veillonella sp.]
MAMKQKKKRKTLAAMMESSHRDGLPERSSRVAYRGWIPNEDQPRKILMNKV